MAANAQAHWREVWAGADSRRLSWYEPAPERSLALVRAAGLGADAAIVDIGGGASGLAAALLDAGYGDITVVDIAPESLASARTALGAAAARITWVQADIRSCDLGRRFDLWHDRATFHFMVTPEDRAAYLTTLRASLSPGGHVVIATFGPDGPTRCSGLPVRRYGPQDLAMELGPDFALESADLHTHHTPSGTGQEYLYARLKVVADRPGTAEEDD